MEITLSKLAREQGIDTLASIIGKPVQICMTVRTSLQQQSTTIEGILCIDIDTCLFNSIFPTTIDGTEELKIPESYKKIVFASSDPSIIDSVCKSKIHCFIPTDDFWQLCVNEMKPHSSTQVIDHFTAEKEKAQSYATQKEHIIHTFNDIDDLIKQLTDVYAVN